MTNKKHFDENDDFNVQIQPENISVDDSKDSEVIPDDVVEDERDTEFSSASTQEQEVEELQQKCVDLNDKNLRLMAEFDNYRKRTLREKSDIIKNAGERIFVDMLPLVDDLERAMQAMDSSDDVESVKEGVDLIYNKFIAFLNVNGVKPIPTEDEVFDVDLHEAVTMFPATSDEQKGKIIECLSKGYTLNDKVIRFPKVVVGE